MSSSPNPTPPSGDMTPPLGGWPGFAAALLRVINGMTSERVLLSTVVFGFGYVMVYTLNSQHEREAMSARQSDEARERDRRHCDDREERIRKESQAEQERMRAWYLQMTEAQRRFESEERSKDRLAITELTKAVLRKGNCDDALLPLLHRAIDNDHPRGTGRAPHPVVYPTVYRTGTNDRYGVVGR